MIKLSALDPIKPILAGSHPQVGVVILHDGSHIQIGRCSGNFDHGSRPVSQPCDPCKSLLAHPQIAWPILIQCEDLPADGPPVGKTPELFTLQLK